MLLTPVDAGGLHKPHHMMALYPYHFLALAFFIGSGLKPRLAWARQIIPVAIISCSLLCAIQSLSSTLNILHHLSENRALDPRWSPRIFDLADYINHEGKSADAIVSIDWGIHNQVHALSDNDVRRKMSDLWLELKLAQRNPDIDAKILNLFKQNDRILVLLYAHNQGVQQASVNQFFRMARHNGIQLNSLHTINDGDNVIYQIFETCHQENTVKANQ